MTLPDPQLSLNTGIRSLVRDVLNELHVSMPGEVVSVDPGGRTATVRARFSINPVEGEDIGFQIPPIYNVPLLAPRAGGFALSFPIAPGDGCLIVWCDHAVDPSAWDGGPLASIEAMRHSYNDAVALVGWQGAGDWPIFHSPTDFVIGREDGSLVIRITPDSKVTIGNEVVGVDLLEILNRLLTGLTTAITSGPTLAFTDTGLLAALLADLATIRG